MKTTDIIRRAGRNLRQAKIRTLLTALAISVGAFTIMASLAAAEGARQYADKLIQSNVDPQALFIVKDKALMGETSGGQTGLREYDPNTTTSGSQTIKTLNQTDVDSLKKRTDITAVRPLYEVSANYVQFSGNDKKYTASLGVYNPDVTSETVAGVVPKLGVDLTGNEAVVPASFAETLGVKASDLVGKTVTLVVQKSVTPPTEEELKAAFATGDVSQLARPETKDISLRVVAAVKPSSLSFSNASAIAISQATAQEIAEFTTAGTSSYQKYFAVTAKATNGHSPESVKKALEKQGFYPQTAKDLQGFLFTIINTILGIVGGFGVIALIASVFGIVNTQYISVLERTQQIGLMKALGARRRDIGRLFRYEAAWVGFLGGLLGVLIAWGVGTALNPYISKWLDLGDSTRLLIFLPAQAAILIVVLVVIAIVAGYFPSRKAAKLDPIEALRTE